MLLGKNSSSSAVRASPEVASEPTGSSSSSSVDDGHATAPAASAPARTRCAGDAEGGLVIREDATGSLQTWYAGQWAQQNGPGGGPALRSGQGMQRFGRDGTLYDGAWVGGAPSGLGRLLWQPTSEGGAREYVGEVADGKPHGGTVVNDLGLKPVAHNHDASGRSRKPRVRSFAHPKSLVK